MTRMLYKSIREFCGEVVGGLRRQQTCQGSPRARGLSRRAGERAAAEQPLSARNGCPTPPGPQVLCPARPAPGTSPQAPAANPPLRRRRLLVRVHDAQKAVLADAERKPIDQVEVLRSVNIAINIDGSLFDESPCLRNAPSEASFKENFWQPKRVNLSRAIYVQHGSLELVRRLGEGDTVVAHFR